MRSYLDWVARTQGQPDFRTAMQKDDVWLGARMGFFTVGPPLLVAVVLLLIVVS